MRGTGIDALVLQNFLCVEINAAKSCDHWCDFNSISIAMSWSENVVIFIPFFCGNIYDLLESSQSLIVIASQNIEPPAGVEPAITGILISLLTFLKDFGRKST